MKPGEVLADWTPKIRQVPSINTPNTCRHCLGPTNAGYTTCHRCDFDWSAHPEFHTACDLIVPATVAVQPSPWYNAVYYYKTGPNFRTLGPALAVVLREWLVNHSDRLAAALGGVPDMAVVVPSRRTLPPTRLHRVASWAVTNTPAFVDLEVSPDAVEFIGPPPGKHSDLYPDALEVDPAMADRRVLLVEDTWVAGSTALSTAIAIRRAGAASIAMVSIARMTYQDGMTPVYEQAATAPIDYSHWPR